MTYYHYEIKIPHKEKNTQIIIQKYLGSLLDDNGLKDLFKPWKRQEKTITIRQIRGSIMEAPYFCTSTSYGFPIKGES